jgi:hypothetical protein
MQVQGNTALQPPLLLLLLLLLLLQEPLPDRCRKLRASTHGTPRSAAAPTIASTAAPAAAAPAAATTAATTTAVTAARGARSGTPTRAGGAGTWAKQRARLTVLLLVLLLLMLLLLLRLREKRSPLVANGSRGVGGARGVGEEERVFFEQQLFWCGESVVGEPQLDRARRALFKEVVHVGGTQIREFGAAQRVDQHVVCLDVAVQQALLVHETQPWAQARRQDSVSCVKRKREDTIVCTARTKHVFCTYPARLESPTPIAGTKTERGLQRAVRVQPRRVALRPRETRTNPTRTMLKLRMIRQEPWPTAPPQRPCA